MPKANGYGAAKSIITTLCSRVIPIKAIRVPNVAGRKGRYGIVTTNLYSQVRAREKACPLPWNGKTLGHEAATFLTQEKKIGKKKAPKNKTFGSKLKACQ